MGINLLRKIASTGPSENAVVLADAVDRELI